MWNHLIFYFNFMNMRVCGSWAEKIIFYQQNLIFFYLMEILGFRKEVLVIICLRAYSPIISCLLTPYFVMVCDKVYAEMTFWVILINIGKVLFLLLVCLSCRIYINLSFICIESIFLVVFFGNVMGNKSQDILINKMYLLTFCVHVFFS